MKGNSNKIPNQSVRILSKPLKNLLLLATWLLIFVTTTGALSIMGMYFWLSDHQEKVVSKTTLHYVESFLNKSKSYKVRLDKSSIQYKDSGINIKSAVTLLQNGSEKHFINIETINLRIETNKIFNLTIPIDVKIVGLELNLNNIKYDPSIKDSHTSISHNANLYQQLEDVLSYYSPRSALHIRNISISDSKLIKNNLRYSINQTSKTSTNYFETILSLKHNKQSATIKTTAKTDASSIKYTTDIDKIPTWLLINLIAPQSFSEIDSMVDHRALTAGKISIEYLKSKKYPILDINIHSYNRIKHSLFGTFNIKGANKGQSQLVFEDISFSTDSTGSLSASMIIDNYRGISLDELSVKGENIPIEQISALWPESTLKTTKTWLRQSLFNGKCDLAFYINMHHVKEQRYKVATIDFRNMDLHYSDDFDPLTHLKGKIEIYNDSLSIDVKDGLLKTSKIFDSNATIYYFEPAIPLHININSKGLATNYLGFLGNSSISSLKSKNVDLNKIGGTAETNVKIYIPLNSNNIKDDIDITATARFQKVNAQIFNSLKLENGELDLNLSNNLLQLTGNISLNQALCKVGLLHNLHDSREFITKISLTTSLTNSGQIKDIIGNKLHIESGKIPLEFTYINSEIDEQILLKANTHSAKISLLDIGFTKEQNDKSSLNLALIKPNGSNWKTELFNFISSGLNINAMMETTSDFNQILHLETHTNYKGNIFKTRYTLDGNNTTLKIEANEIKLDTANILKLFTMFTDSDDDSSTYNANKNITYSVQIDKLIMKNNIIFSDIIGNLECNRNHCKNSGFAMKINGKDPVSITLNEGIKGNEWVFKTTNAAGFLKGLDIYKDIEGGNLEAHVHYMHHSNLDKNSQPIMVGTVHMKEFNAIKTPIITKMILLSPFSVIKNLERSSLIPFEDMEISFVLANQKLEINRSHAKGKVLAVSLYGFIDGKNKQINLQGRVIPKSQINTAMASLKGKNASISEKEGVVGNNFTITGEFSNPEVHMNPIGAILSFLLRLTPIGLL